MDLLEAEIILNSAQPSNVDREMIVAHATLSAFIHHWPSKAQPEISELLTKTKFIRDLENSRWHTQRRIAISKLSRIIEN